MYRYATLDPQNNVMSVVVWDGQGPWQVPNNAILLPDNSPVTTGWRYLPATNSFLASAGGDPNAPIRRLEKIDFMRLFKVDELVRYKLLRLQINSLTQDDYIAAMTGDQSKLMMVQADVYFDRFDLASQVEMDHPETIAALQMLAQAGIFGYVGTEPNHVTQEYVDERVATVLAGLLPNQVPVTPPETPADEPPAP